MRPDWDNYSEVVSSRSTCLRRKVGAVIVNDKHIISTGYSQSPTTLEVGAC